MIALTRSFAAAVAVLVLAACGGGAKSVPVVPAASAVAGASSAKTPAVAMKVKLTIPAGRKPSFVSPSTAGVSINAYVAIAGPSTAIFQAFDLTTGCTQNSDGSQTCSLTVSAPVGNDDFVVTAYDQSPSNCNGYSGTLPGSCNVLSQGTTLQTIAANSSNTIDLAMGGTIASIAFAPSSYTVAASPPSTLTLSIEALDADQNIILGPDAYSNPIALTIVGDSGNDFSFSNGTHSLVISAPPSTAQPLTATVTYDGNLSSGSFTVTASSGSLSTSAALTIGGTSATLPIPGFPSGGLAVAQPGDYYCGFALPARTRKSLAAHRRRPARLSGYYGYNIDLYAPNTAVPLGSSSSPYGITLSVSNDACSLYPAQIAFDPAGDVFVADSGNEQVDVWYASTLEGLYPYGTSSSPDVVINGPPFVDVEGVAADANGDVYVLDDEANLSGAATPVGVIAYGPPNYETKLFTLYDNSLTYGSSIAIDPATSDLLVANCSTPTSTPCGSGFGWVSSYTVGSSSPAFPVATINDVYPGMLSPVPVTISSGIATGAASGSAVTLISQNGSPNSAGANGPVLAIATAPPGYYPFSPGALAVESANNANLAVYDSQQNIAMSTWDAGTSMWEVQFFPPSATTGMLQGNYSITGFGYLELYDEPSAMAAAPALIFDASRSRSPQGRRAGSAGKAK